MRIAMADPPYPGQSKKHYGDHPDYAGEFDPALLGTLEVSARNGRSAVFDGQHRFAALRKIGRRSVPCIVHRELSVADEARLFVQLQTERKALPPLDRFRARIVAGEEQAIAIERIAKAAGYEVSGNGTTSSIGAVTALDRTFALDKTGDVLAGALDLLSIWRGEPKATDGALIQGLGLFVRDHGEHPKVADGSVVVKFEEVPARVILRRAIADTTNGGGSGTRPVAVLKELRKLAGVRAPRVSGATFLDQLAAYAERQDLRLATWNATQQEPGHGVALRSKVGSRELLSAESYDSVEIAAMYALDALRSLGVPAPEAGGQS